MNQILCLHKGPILKFHHHIPNTSLDSFQEVAQFMLLLSRNSVRELILTNLNQHYELPSYLFSCLELSNLRLENCYIRQPLEVERFPNLEKLYLQNIDFGANLCGTQINLPQLKKLSLHKCTNVQDVMVCACPDAMLLWLLDSPCLFKAVIAPRKPVQDFVRVEKMNLATMLSNLPRVEWFYMDNHFVKFLVAEKNPKLLPCPISSLKHLGLLGFQVGDLEQLHGALCLLRNSPNLETLYIMHMKVDPQDDVGGASNHLESRDCLDCTLDLLQTVEIISLEGSRTELLFIKLLLAQSPSLKEFTISPSIYSDVQKRLDIAKDVMQVPRSSPNAKTFYVDLEP